MRWVFLIGLGLLSVAGAEQTSHITRGEVEKVRIENGGAHTIDVLIENQTEQAVEYTFSSHFEVKPVTLRLEPGKMQSFRYMADPVWGNGYASYRPSGELSSEPVDRVLGNRRLYAFRKTNGGINLTEVGELDYSVTVQNRTSSALKVYFRDCEEDQFWQEVKLGAGESRDYTYDPSPVCQSPQISFWTGFATWTKYSDIQYFQKYAVVESGQGKPVLSRSH